MRNPISSLIAYGKVLLSYVGKPQLLQIQGSGTVRDKVQHAQAYGFCSRPLVGAEAVTLNLGGNAAQSICIVVSDRRYVMQLAEGEVALHDDQGQQIYLTRDGIVIQSPLAINVQAPKIEMLGDVYINGIRQVGN